MIGVIADDLTGAAEIGGIGCGHGLKSEVIIRSNCEAAADLLCVDTDSRSCTAKEAARRATSAARKLQRAGAVWIYKKVDSVLRGNLVAEIQAIQQTLNLQSTLLVPANPCFGRVIRGGHYFINGKPIDQTDFAYDPQYPRTTSSVLELLGAAKTRAVTVTRLAAPLPTSGIILGEVSSSKDVQQWAARLGKNILPAGGAEFFAAVINAVGRKLTTRPALPDSATTSRNSKELRELFICGSTSEFTNRFVNEARANGTPVFSLLESERENFSFTRTILQDLIQNAISALHSNQRVILTIGRPLIARRAIAQKLTAYLVQVAVAVMARSKPHWVYAEGGATAAELVRRLGWNRMKVLKELAPGVTTLSLPAQESPLLTIKPGSYPGWPTNR
jgi:uncharacterized protein YgbK (DUF1537 family)